MVSTGTPWRRVGVGAILAVVVVAGVTTVVVSHGGARRARAATLAGGGDPAIPLAAVDPEGLAQIGTRLREPTPAQAAGARIGRTAAARRAVALAGLPAALRARGAGAALGSVLAMRTRPGVARDHPRLTWVVAFPPQPLTVAVSMGRVTPAARTVTPRHLVALVDAVTGAVEMVTWG